MCLRKVRVIFTCLVFKFSFNSSYLCVCFGNLHWLTHAELLPQRPTWTLEQDRYLSLGRGVPRPDRTIMASLYVPCGS